MIPLGGFAEIDWHDCAVVQTIKLTVADANPHQIPTPRYTEKLRVTIPDLPMNSQQRCDGFKYQVLIRG